jgi:N-acetylneuraminate synthase
MLIKTGKRLIGPGQPVYFVADIAANHDGNLERARKLIRLAAQAGADAAKFQNFRAPEIVSEYGFAHLGQGRSHQAAWKKTVFRVYEDASLPWEWTPVLRAECDKAGIDFFSTPYDLDAVEMLGPHVSIFKIGSGDIDWIEMLTAVAGKQKPVILATGASDMREVGRAVRHILAVNPALVLLQCNTNYAVSRENFRHINLTVLKTYQTLFPGVICGLSDHTKGHTAVLGAVALGGKVIEKHFTDDDTRDGPDHSFSMTPVEWREMVERTRELEMALGNGEKVVEENERETLVVQRRCIRAARPLPAGTVIRREDLKILRPAPPDAIKPSELDRVVGMRVRLLVPEGEYLSWPALEP